MLTYRRHFGERSDHAVAEVVGMRAREAQTSNAGHAANGSQQLGESGVAIVIRVHGLAEQHDFADLLRAVGTVPGIRRVRYTSPHPNDFSDRVIEAMADTPTVCEHVHLPMQSGSSRMLKRMLRRYTREGYLECVARIRRAIPRVTLTTDVIVGFPGETDEDFEETLDVVRQVGFADAFTFKFSPRDGTPATRMPAELTVPDDVASARLARLVDTVRGISRAANLQQLGRRYEVLVEKVSRRGDDVLQTRTRDFKTVLVPGDERMLGQYLDVELTGTTGSTFTGQVIRRRERLPLPLAV